VGEPQNIEYTILGSVPTIDILYDSGSGYTAITPPTGISTVSYPDFYPWPGGVPDDISDAVMIKIQDHDDTDIFDESDNAFKIKGMVTVDEPVLNEVLHAGVEKAIEWTLGGSVTGTADIRLSTDGGTSYGSPIASVDITSSPYPWTPTAAQMNVNMIKVGLQGDDDPDTGTAGESGVFSVEANLTLDYPNAPDVPDYFCGDVVYIRWTPNPVDFGLVNIRYDTNSGLGADGQFNTGDEYLGTVASNIASNNDPGSGIGYEWTTTPAAVGPKTRIKIFQAGKEAEVHDESEYDFNIKGSITLTGDAVGGGAPWEVGTNKSITWTAVGDLTPVNIYYTLTGAEPYNQTLVTDHPAGTGNQEYRMEPIPDNIIPNDRNTNVKFQVAFKDDTSINDESTNPITIQAKITVSEPTGQSTVLKVYGDDLADRPHIGWTTYGNVPQVDLRYDTQGGLGGYTGVIDSGITNLEGYDLWEIPDIIGDDVKVKVMSSASGDYVYGESNESFKVKGQIKITEPNQNTKDADAWLVDNTAAGLPSTEDISWTNYGTLGGADSYLTIKYAFNGVDFDPPNGITLTTEASGANGPQTWEWTIPDKIGTTNKIQIIDDNTVPANPAQSQAFEIKGQLKLIEPIGGETYYVGGADIDVQWKYAGTLSSNLDLYYDSNEGLGPDGSPNTGDEYETKINTEGAVAYNKDEDGSYICHYSWPVPSTAGTKYRLKIQYRGDNAVKVTSNQNFVVKGSVTLSYPGKNPASPETWCVDGASNSIGWTVTGGLAEVDILLNTNSGADWNDPLYN